MGPNTDRVHPCAKFDVIETGGRGRVRTFLSLPTSILVLERLGKERFERSLVCADVAHEDEVVEWVGRGGSRLRLCLCLGLGMRVRTGGGFAALVVGRTLI